jgi:hypothetical protein
MSATAISPHIARIATSPGSQLIGGRDVEIHQGALLLSMRQSQSVARGT